MNDEDNHLAAWTRAAGLGLLLATASLSGCSCSEAEPPREDATVRDDAAVEATGCAPPDPSDSTRAGVDLRTSCISGLVALTHQLDFFGFARVYDDTAGWFWTFDQTLTSTGSGYELRSGPYRKSYAPSADDPATFVPSPADGTRITRSKGDALVLHALDRRHVYRSVVPGQPHTLVRAERLGGPDDSPAVVAWVDLGRDAGDGGVRTLTDAGGRTVNIDVEGGEPRSVVGPTPLDAWTLTRSDSGGSRVLEISRPGPNGPAIRHLFGETAGALAWVMFPDDTAIAWDRQAPGQQVRHVRTLDAVGTTRASFAVLACESPSIRTVMLGDPGGPPSVPYVRRLEYPLAGGAPVAQLARAVSPTGRWVAYSWNGPNGDVAAVTTSVGHGAQIDYHPGTREPTSITMLPGGRVIYQSSGLSQPTLLPTSITLDDARTVVRSYDALGRLRSSQRGTETVTVTRQANAGTTTVCTWLSNTATGVVDQSGGCIDEDARERSVAAHFGGGDTTIERIGDSGLPNRVTKPSGDRIEYGHDGDLLTSIARTGEPTESFGWAASRMVSATDGARSRSYAYTDYGVLRSADLALGVASWSTSIQWTPDKQGVELSVNGKRLDSVHAGDAPLPPPLSCTSL